MKKVFRIILIVVLILAIAVSAFVAWQWNNFKALFTVLNCSTEQINTLIEENEKKTDEILNILTESDIHSLSDEEREMLKNGELSEEDALNIIKGNQIQTESNLKIDDIISRIYLLRAKYINDLSALESSAIAEAKAIPPEERTISKKLDFLEKYTGRAVALEKECDAKMEGLISELKTELSKSGRDKKIISEIRSAYASEKELKKSQLLSKYSKYLK